MAIQSRFIILLSFFFLYACGTESNLEGEHSPEAADSEGVHLSRRGVLLLKQGQPRKALVALREAAVRLPGRASVHFNLGLAHVRLGEHRLAIPPFQQAVALDSLNASFHFVLGDALSAEHRDPEAVSQYQRAIDLDPKQALYYYQLGKSLRATAAFDGAIAAFDAALALDAGFEDALYHRSELLARSNRAAEAEAGYKKLLQLAPRHVAALIDLAGLQTQGGTLPGPQSSGESR